MKISIKRFLPNSYEKIEDFDIKLENITLLEALEYIKTKIDPTLTYNSGCRSEICGSCAVVVNAKEVLSCAYKVQDGDIIEPLRRVSVIKDLIVDTQKAKDTLLRVRSWLEVPSTKQMSIEDEKLIETQSDCILCSSCYSSCPVLEVNKEFLGPFALTRSYRYISDIRINEDDKNKKIEIIQKNGIWDCTLCGECSLVCPQNIDPKNDILMLQSKSIQQGYSNPAFSNDNFNDFGFNPDF